ncbi:MULTISPECIES: hypothetical protein [Caballeronia]|uniref:hypothetical protein n=1 Tax=Caballeronia TaxID=1827195 RepID=UPI001EF546C8|nr:MULTISPECIES: hypothetical protein [Caballeronia]MCG7402259.1 hypothetical protein [Caballeronia zhejiangensis]MCI1047133.1 hypothetical protein [Caballeronia zhejiangensis]
MTHGVGGPPGFRLGRAVSGLAEWCYRDAAIFGIFVAVVVAGYAVIARRIGVADFSPDSWSYFELAKSVFSDHFYQFNNRRSYVPGVHSAAFPFGYPVVLALLGAVFGSNPLVGLYFNVATVLGSALVLERVAARLGLRVLIRLALACVLVLNPFYMDEVLSARSIPFAILLFLAGLLLALENRAFWSGLCLGAASLVRFDAVPMSAIAFVLFALFVGRTRRNALMMAAGLILAMAPWAVYSHRFFGKFWVSDNSWVAASAVKAYVLDYPAAPTIGARQAPGLWLHRVLDNVRSLYLALRALSQTLWPALPLLAVATWRLHRWPTRRAVGFLATIAGLALTLVPYLMTGYFNTRYFVLPYVLLTLLVFWAASVPPAAFARVASWLAAVLLIALTVPDGVSALKAILATGEGRQAELQEELGTIAQLSACHERTPQTTFIFRRDAANFSFRYAALTGQRAATLPSNIDSLSAAQRKDYFSVMLPYALVDDPRRCPTTVLQ